MSIIFDPYEYIDTEQQKTLGRRALPGEQKFFWQHMLAEYFYKLLGSKSIYLRSMADYDQYENKPELDPFELLRPFLADQGTVGPAINKLKEVTYISCWYGCDDLSQRMFEQFTHGGNGVAIKTTSQKIIGCLEMLQKKSPMENYYFGPVIYIRDHQPHFLKQKQIIESDKGKQIGTVAPFFLKESRYRDEEEYRILCRIPRNLNTGFFFGEPEKISPNISISLCDFIEGIAVSEYQSDAFVEMLKFLVKKHGYQMDKSPENMPGFQIFNLKERPNDGTSTLV